MQGLCEAREVVVCRMGCGSVWGTSLPSPLAAVGRVLQEECRGREGFTPSGRNCTLSCACRTLFGFGAACVPCGAIVCDCGLGRYMAPSRSSSFYRTRRPQYMPSHPVCLGFISE